MPEIELRKHITISIIFSWLLILLAACQPDIVATPDDTSLIVTDTTTTATVETTPTPKNTSAPSALPTHTAILTATLLPPEPTATAEPTMTPTRTSFSGWLVFSSRRQDTNEDGTIDEKDGTNLYKLDASTGQIVQLTFGNHRDLHPVWSPDSSQVAFVSNRDGNFELYVMNADGSEIKRLTNTLENETVPRWSPDGTSLVYVLVKTLDSGLQEKHLHLISASGENSKQLTFGPENEDDPDWSPDGRYLVFTRIEEFMNAEGVINNENAVYLMDIQTRQTFRLTPSTQESGQGEFEDPTWLPRDGHFLSMTQAPGDLSSVGIKVFELEWENGQPALYRVFSIADAYGRYAWGPNGEWLISIDSNDQFYGTVPNEALNDLVLLPVDFSTQVRATTADPAARTSYNYSLNDGELITNDTFYDDYPDWTP
jgi:Tol biopolymer transport system component